MSYVLWGGRISAASCFGMPYCDYGLEESTQMDQCAIGMGAGINSGKHEHILIKTYNLTLVCSNNR